MDSTVIYGEDQHGKYVQFEYQYNAGQVSDKWYYENIRQRGLGFNILLQYKQKRFENTILEKDRLSIK